MQPIFETCVPRDDVIAGRLRDEEFAAELAKVVNGTATPEYGEPAVFFRHTHPTDGIKALLANVCQRLTDAGGELNSVIRLDNAVRRRQDACADRVGARRSRHGRGRARRRVC